MYGRFAQYRMPWGREPFWATGRCIMLADSWYKWVKNPDAPKKKQPFYIHRRDKQPMYFAGIGQFRRDGGAPQTEMALSSLPLTAIKAWSIYLIVGRSCFRRKAQQSGWTRKPRRCRQSGYCTTTANQWRSLTGTPLEEQLEMEKRRIGTAGTC